MVRPGKHKRGFTLVEVLTSIIVMSMMSVALFAFLDYGGRNWYKGKDQLDTANYARIVFDLFAEEFFGATNIYISQPEVNLADLWPTPPADTLVIDPDTASHTTTLFYIREIKGIIIGNTTRACFEIVLDPVSHCLYRESEDAGLENGTLVGTPLGATQYDVKRWGKVRFARNVMSFSATRMSAQTVKINIVFGEDTDEDGILDAATSEHSMIFLAPQLEAL